MKTTVVIDDRLFTRARRAAKARGLTMRALIEEALRRTLDETPNRAPPFQLADRSVGTPGGRNPFAGKTWDEIRSVLYGEPGDD
jgi:hypothetical protein